MPGVDLKPIEPGSATLGLLQHPPSSIDVAVDVGRPCLDFGYGLDPQAYDLSSDGVAVSVATTAKGVLREAWADRVQPRTRAEDRRWQSGTVDLSRHVGEQVVVTLITDAAGASDYDWAMWTHVRLGACRSGNEGSR